MQIFHPYPDINKSLRCLSKQRLGKQRVEAYQVINTIINSGGWKHHPVTLMYKDFLPYLIHYYNECLIEFERTGGKNIKLQLMDHGPVITPPFIGDDKLHESHRQNLWRKANLDSQGFKDDGISHKKVSYDQLCVLEREKVPRLSNYMTFPYYWPHQYK